VFIGIRMILCAAETLAAWLFKRPFQISTARATANPVYSDRPPAKEIPMILCGAPHFGRHRRHYAFCVLLCCCTMTFAIGCQGGNPPASPAPKVGAQAAEPNGVNGIVAKATTLPTGDELLCVTCKQMVPSGGPAAYVLEHLKFNMTKQLLWTDKYGAPKKAAKHPCQPKPSYMGD